MRILRPLLSVLISCLLAGAQQPPPLSILQIRTIEGEGVVNPAGGRSARPVSVQVTDETGRPVEGVAVSFRLPEEGAGGAFASGMRSEVVVTGADGRAAVWGIQWKPLAGPVQIRVTAVKNQARAGVVISQYVSDAVADKPKEGKGAAGMAPGARGKWFYTILVVCAGGAAAGAAVGLSRYSKAAPAAPAIAAIEEPALRVGTPLITIGKP